MKRVPVLTGMAELMDHYDGFIVDLWGVIHDGERLYSHVINTLQHMKKYRKSICFLSNAPRRVSMLEDGLTEMGVDRTLYDSVMSSGEAVFGELLNRANPWFASLGRCFYHLGPERDEYLFDGLGLIRTTMNKAGFILNTGIYNFDDTPDTFMDLLMEGRRYNLPMVCANPDQVIVREGQMICCAGAIAERYRSLGGEVVYRGKPDPAIYDICLSLLGTSDRSRVAAVGDSFATDIAGAAAARIDSVLVAGGIHAEELGLPPENPHGEMPDPIMVMEASRKRALSPVAVIPVFDW